MSHSFTVRTKQDINLTLKAFIDRLQSLDFFDLAELKIWYEGNSVNSASMGDLSLSIDGRHICFEIDDRYIHVTYHILHYDDKLRKWWSIESRALEGIGRSFYVAAASIIADLTDGLVHSGDGAWHDPDTHRGTELWQEYLKTELDHWDRWF